MDLIRNHILSILIFLPIAAGIALVIVPRRYAVFIRWFAFISGLVAFALSILLFLWFRSNM
ncbi:MAG TPA: hypothetical protein PLU88_15505, partial [Armatimonadota bacterium]|nr:hypothetical protein [Armatimonadota bacterium]